MTNCEFSEKGNEFYVGAWGHAGYAEKGQDIVCAGVSILMQTLEAALGMTEHTEASVTKRDGACLIRFGNYDESEREMVRGMFRSCVVGLKLLAVRYPEHVSIRKESGTE